MRLFLIILFIQLLAVPISGQVAYHSEFEEQAFNSNDPLQLIVASDPRASYSQYTEIRDDLDQLLQKIDKKQSKYKHTDQFLEWTFYYVHRKMFGRYENYVSLNDLFVEKKYDCLTGTILYSIILDHLKIPYTIYEFDYHILLVVNLPDNDILMEATDPLAGYVEDPDEIAGRLAHYLSSQEDEFRPVGEKYPQESSSVKTDLDLKKLAGLQYFNMAIKSYSMGEFPRAIQYINKAELLYPSNRMMSIKRRMVTRL